MGRQLTKEGAGFVAAHEGLYLYAYPDPGTGREPWTIGLGHTTAAGGPSVKLGDIWPIEKVWREFERDAVRFENDVDSAIRVPVKPYQFDAVADWHFNTGAAKKGSVIPHINAGRVDSAMATLELYVNAGGRRMEGLATRRKREVALYRTGTYPALKILVKDRPGAQGRMIPASSIVWREPGEKPKVPITMDVPTPVPRPGPAMKPVKENFLLDILYGLWDLIK